MMMKSRPRLSQSLHILIREGAPSAMPPVTPVSPLSPPPSTSSMSGTQARFSLSLPLPVSLKVMMRTSKTMRNGVNVRCRSLIRRNWRKRGGHRRAYLFLTGIICSTRTSQRYWKWSLGLYYRMRCSCCWCWYTRRPRDRIEPWVWCISSILLRLIWIFLMRYRVALVAGDSYRTFHCELLLLGTYATLFFFAWTRILDIGCINHMYFYNLSNMSCFWRYILHVRSPIWILPGKMDMCLCFVSCVWYDYDMIFSFD